MLPMLSALPSNSSEHESRSSNLRLSFQIATLLSLMEFQSLLCLFGM